MDRNAPYLNRTFAKGMCYAAFGKNQELFLTENCPYGKMGCPDIEQREIVMDGGFS